MSPQDETVLPEVPRLPQRAAIYIAPDGGVKFGALFEDLLPVAAAISAAPLAGRSRLACTVPSPSDQDVER